jgi:hypothetical protein
VSFRFIFMLTRQDRTVADAADRLEVALAAGVEHIGFKDVGVPFTTLQTLNRMIQAAGAASYLEVVSCDREAELASVRAGVELGVDYLMGGAHADDVLPLLKGTGVRYYPFPGKVVGHPSVLEGPAGDILASARDLAARPGVDGLDLLAYRSRIDVGALIAAVCAAVGKPVIVAGSIERPEQVHAARRGGAAGFTVGSAALEGRFPAAGPDLRRQLAAIMAASSKPVG